LEQISNEGISHYFGSDPAVLLTKYTNGFDVVAPPGPPLIVDGHVQWTYQVLNSGNITLTQLIVLDQEGLVVDPASAEIVCEIEALGPGLSEECSLEGVVIAGQYRNTAAVSGLPPVGETVIAEDQSYYYGAGGLFLPLIIR
jgi:hypothetical protein